MDTAALSPAFLTTALVVVLMPGAGVLYTLAHGLGLGARASVIAAFGCTLGIVPHLTAAVLGLAALLHASALAFQVVKIAGVVYLLYMAWSLWRETGALPLKAETHRLSARRIITRGILINILNPKLSLFFMAFLPQFVSPNATQPTLEMLVLSGVFMALTFAVFVVYGVFAAGARRYVIDRPVVMTWMRRSFAAAFAGLGIKLALTDR